jgi:hypothetical protein
VHLSTPGKITVTFSRRLALVLALVGTVSTGAVTGLILAPGSPGLPFVSPTYEAQPATAQYYGISLNAALYGVWYVPGTSTLILDVMAAFPHTHFVGVGAIGTLFGYPSNTTISPQGNFSTQVYMDNQKTFLVFPGNLCPDTSKIPASGFVVDVELVSDAPPGILSFQYTCVQKPALALLTLGNPHVIVPSLIPITPPPSITQTGREALNLEAFSFPNGSYTNVILDLRNTGTASLSLASYYVKDSSGDQWALTSWTGPTINPNALGQASVAIGSACGSCTYSGGSGAFNQFSAGNSYTITIITARNNQFTFTVVR